MASIEALLDTVDPFLGPARLCQAFFILVASGVLVVAATPPSARGLLTQYGARNSSPHKNNTPAKVAEDQFTSLIAWATSIGKVPHSWFIHFYVLSVSSSIFWATQYVCHCTILDAIAESQVARDTASSMTIRQVQLAWLLMAMQGFRRLYECHFVMRTSSSQMWVVHWLLGCAYYLCIGIATWIEGSDAIIRSDRQLYYPTWPSVKEFVGLSLFFFAWSMQYSCHKHLAGLKKYTCPEAGMFRYLICPHYTCECLLYLSLAIVAAPVDQLYNRTLMCGMIFVAANLGVTASGTRKWYGRKFGDTRIANKWNMIPFIY